MCNHEFEIFQLVEEELSKNESDKILEHINACKDCREVYEEYLSLKGSVISLYHSISPNKYLEIKGIEKSNKIYKRRRVYYYTAAAVILIGMLVAFINYSFDVDNTYEEKNTIVIKMDTRSQLEIDLEILKISSEIEIARAQINKRMLETF